jgi:hypothetical protein
VYPYRHTHTEGKRKREVPRGFNLWAHVVVGPALVFLKQTRHSWTLALLYAGPFFEDTSTDVAEDLVAQTVHGVTPVGLLHPRTAARAFLHPICLGKLLELGIVFLRGLILVYLHSNKRHFPPSVASHRHGVKAQLPLDL